MATPLSHDPATSKTVDLHDRACEWFLRKQAGPLSDTEALAFADWYAASPDHRRAYVEAEARWQDPPLLAALRLRRNTRPAYMLWLLLLATALACLHLLDPLTRWRAARWTGIGELATMTLQDGSILHLDATTAVAVDFTDKKRRLHLLRGEIYCEVTSNTDRPFTVLTPNSHTRVVGTGFTVHTDAKTDTVSVIHGSVQVNTIDQHAPPRTLTGRDQIHVTGKRLGRVVSTADSAVLDWLHGSLSLEQVPLQQALQRLQRYWPGYIYFRDADLRSYRISGRFRLERPSDIIDLLALTLPIKITRITPWLLVIG